MDLFEAINRRHSYRGEFTQALVPRDDLTKIVNAGIQAPSGYNGQSTSFVVIDDKTVLRSLIELMGSGDHLRTAQAAIAVVMDPTATSDKAYSFGVEDYAAAVENMLLAVQALGYATVWIDGALRRNQVARKIAALLGIPDSLEVRVVLPLGVPVEPKSQGPKKPFSERAWFNRYGHGVTYR